MGPAQVISLVRDALIVGALAWVVFFLYHAGANSVRVADVKALQQQIAANAVTEERYHNELNDAFAEANSQMGNLAHSIDANKRPVFVRLPPSGRALPGDPATPVDPAPQGGTVDIRPGINAFELKYETALAQCRALQEAWPH